MFTFFSFFLLVYIVCTATMSFPEANTDTTPFFSDEEEERTDIKEEAPSNEPDAECASGVSNKRALMTVAVLCYINLLNYMDRFTVAGMYISSKVHVHCAS